MINWDAKANSLRDQLVAWRRDFHMHPELGFQETRTAALVAAELERLGYEVQTGVGKTGVVGLLAPLPPFRDGPVVLLRFDMDALPLQEENDVPYRSQRAGVMHACGHDAHVAIGLGVATLLARSRDKLKGVVKLMFQPGEEGMNGAGAMIEDGVLANPRPDVALAAHVWNDLPLGRVGVTAGPVMAASEVFECTIRGEGGHGASPHQTADPVVAAAQLINAWQTVISRNVDPKEMAVLSVCSVRAGEAFNIIPDAATLKGTIRTFDADVRQRVLRRLQQVAEGVCAAMGCAVEMNLQSLTPALVNDPRVTASVRQLVAGTVGEKQVVALQTTGSEDMALVNAEIPGCFMFIGSQNKAAGFDHPHHNPFFDIDEGVLPLGVALLVKAAVSFLGG